MTTTQVRAGQLLLVGAGSGLAVAERSCRTSQPPRVELPTIPALQEAEGGRAQVQGQLGQFSEVLSQNKK